MEADLSYSRTAARCQLTIDAFLRKIQRYQPAIGRTVRTRYGLRVKDAWMKVKGALCKKEDVTKFKADLVAHTESIQLLLATVQMSVSRLERYG
jgi:hypothetical protein